jgi:hypothetical protein
MQNKKIRKLAEICRAKKECSFYPVNGTYRMSYGARKHRRIRSDDGRHTEPQPECKKMREKVKSLQRHRHIDRRGFGA